MDAPPIIFSHRDLIDLRYAKSLLDHPSFTVRLANLVGAPIEGAMALLPAKWHDKINVAAKAALFHALDVAIATTRRQRASAPTSNRFHKVLVGASGGIGGAF